jgi:hypothetical protein
VIKYDPKEIQNIIGKWKQGTAKENRKREEKE